MRLFLSLLMAGFLVVLASCGRPVPPGGHATYTGGSKPQIGDNKPHTWRGGHPYNNPIHGIDVSRYQGDIDWHRVRSAGVDFVYIKATEGGDHADPSFRRYWAGAASAGIPRGAYHYYYFCRSGVEQAAWFIANVPRGHGALPPVIDLEWTHSRTCPHRPQAAEIRAEALSFINALERYYGHRPIIYTTVDFYRDNDLGRMPAEFWLRSVADHPRNIYPGQRWTFWQYSGTGSVPGIQGNVDLNTFSGSAAQWRQWLATHLR